MVVSRWVVLLLLASGCPGEPSSEGSGESGSDSGTSSTPSDTTQGPTPTPGAETGGSTSASSGDGADSETGTGEESGSSSTGVELPPGSPGCFAAQNLADGEHQFMLDGYDRRYILRLPDNYSNEQPWPLIFALHGNGGNPGYWDGMGGDRDIRSAFAEDAVIIIAEAIDNRWRDYDAPSEEWPERIELELNYFDTIYEVAQDELCIDVDNVFSMGFSGGGSFSGVLGCRRDYIRAVAVGGSVIYFEPDQCVSTPAAWITIGEGEFTDGRAAFRDFFRDLGGCQESSMATDPQGCEIYDGCDPQTPVHYCSHPAGHVWPSIGTDATKAFFESFYGAG